MLAYNKISQTEHESVSQYLMHAKDYLECINHTSKLSSVDGSGLNHVSLVQGLCVSYVRRRASKEAENWRTMADAFDSITKIEKTAGKTQAYNKPRYELSSDVNIISHHTNSQRGSFSRYWGRYRSTSNNNRTNTHFKCQQAAGNYQHKQGNNKEPTCYHCKGPHHVTNCARYQEDKDKYKHTKQKVKTKLSK